MKTLKLIALTAFALLFSQCKTTAPTGAPSGGTASVLEAYQMLGTTDSMLRIFADSTTGSPSAALARTALWLNSQPGVASVATLDNTYLTVTMKSGLISTFSIERVDSSGIADTRGGGPNAKGHLEVTGNASAHSIDNKSILIWAAAYNEFYRSGEMLNVTKLIDQSPVGLKFDLLLNSDCTYQSLSDFGKYGLVLIDTHGIPDAILTGTSILIQPTPRSEADFRAAIDAAAGAGTYDKIRSGELGIDYVDPIDSLLPAWQKDITVHHHDIRILARTRYLNELPSMPNTIIFANCCYSGANFTTSSALSVKNSFLNKNPICYYGYAYSDGYSAQVDNGFSKQMEASLVKALTIANDSTGSAYLQSNGSKFIDQPGLQKGLSTQNLYLLQFASDDYSYQHCGDPFTDARDGQKYATVCIGKQIWMAQNLNYAAPGSSCYNDTADYCSTYGRLYDWPTMMQGAAASNANPSGVRGVCPNGWHVPSLPEWTQLINALGGSSVAGGALKKDTILWLASYSGVLGSPGTNSSGFSALPAGEGGLVGSNWSGAGIGGETWFGTASSDPSSTPTTYYSPYLVWNDVTTTTEVVQPIDGTSCRCVKDP